MSAKILFSPNWNFTWIIIIIKLSIICNRAMLVSKGHEEDFIQWPFLKTLPSPANWGNEHHSEENVRRLKCSDAFRRGFPWFQLPEISIFEEIMLILHLKVFFLNPQFLKWPQTIRNRIHLLLIWQNRNNVSLEHISIWGYGYFWIILDYYQKIKKYLYKTLT